MNTPVGTTNAFQFHICTPSSAGLLTGRYPIRTGLGWGVILQLDDRTLPLSEVTIPRALKPSGYVSGLFGKWQLGHMGPDWQPTKHGFDHFFGIPYSHDKAQSAYVEVVEEIDSIVGRLLDKLKALKLERDTLVIFTSDNGPWYEGSTGTLRDRKGGAGYDGGYRVPFIAWRPGYVPAGRRCNSIAMGIDFLPTFCAMAGQPLPANDIIDGKDISAILTTGAPSPHEALLLFNDEDVVAVRTQQWKFVADTYYHGHLSTIDGPTYPQLYDMSRDTSESYSAAERHPDAVLHMRALLRDARVQFAPLKSKEIPKGYLASIRQMQAGSPKQD